MKRACLTRQDFIDRGYIVPKEEITPALLERKGFHEAAEAMRQRSGGFRRVYGEPHAL